MTKRMTSSFGRALTSIILAVVLVATMGVTQSLAATNDKPEMEKPYYDGGGKVEVDFYGHVKYKNLKIKVKDSSGKSYKTSIISRDDDDLEFRIKKFKAGKKYTFTISGVAKRYSDTYYKIKGKVSIPKATTVKLRGIEYDFEDQELSIELNKNVRWKKAKVTVTDASGKSYKTRIVEKDSDDIEVKVTGLNYGSKYNVKVSGMKPEGGKKFISAKGSFYAYDD